MEKLESLAALSALAHETRLDVFRLLIQAGPEGRPVGHIAERLDLPSATLSFHLNELRQAGLVTFRRDGRSLIYSAEIATMQDLVGYLTENCCGGEAADCDVATAACTPATRHPRKQKQSA